MRQDVAIGTQALQICLWKLPVVYTICALIAYLDCMTLAG